MLVSAAIVIAAVLVVAPPPAVAVPGWSDPVKISGDVTLTITPYKRIALDSSGYLHVTWMAGTNSLAAQIYYTDNTSGGWPATSTRLSTDPAGSKNMEPQIAVDSNGSAHVVWRGNDGITDQIYYADNTIGWPATPTSLPSATGWDPQIAVDSNRYSHVTWSGMVAGVGSQILYANNISGWPPLSTSISNDPTVIGNAYPKMALDSNGYAHVTWVALDTTFLYQSHPTVQIYYADNTSDWPAIQTRISDPGSHENLDAEIAVDSNGYSHVVWMGGGILTGNIYYTDNTSGWPAIPTGMPTGPVSGQNLYPQIAVDSNGYSHVVWMGNREDGIGCLYADNTSGWPVTPTRLSTGTPARSPQISADSSGFVHMSWSEETGGNSQIYYVSNSSGWPATPIDISGVAFQDTGLPQVVIDSHDRPHLVWNGVSGSEAGLYYSYALPTPIPTPSPYPTPEHLILSSGDYDGDGHDDIAIFRPENGLWAVRGLGRTYFGMAGDVPVSGDYDGDGITDVSIFRPSLGLWAVKNITRIYFGGPDDIPVPGDYSGDGSCDPAVFLDTTGRWAARAISRVYFGAVNDRPVPYDFEGSGTDSIGIFRPASGLWAIRDLTRFYFGISGDRPVPGVYQWYGSGKSADSFRTQAAVFRPGTGCWAIKGLTRTYFGSSGDTPVRGSFAGSALDEFGVFRPETGLWSIRGITRAYYGSSGDIPVTR